MDRGLLVTELGHGHGDLTVDVSLVGLSYHLVNEVLNVGSGGCKFRSVIKHYRISSLALDSRPILSFFLQSGLGIVNDKVFFHLFPQLFFFE